MGHFKGREPGVEVPDGEVVGLGRGWSFDFGVKRV